MDKRYVLFMGVRDKPIKTTHSSIPTFPFFSPPLVPIISSCFSSQGFSIEGPSQARIECNDNGDGSADVRYFPTAPGEYALHILCNNKDVPGSPYIAQILPKTDYYPEKVCVKRNDEKDGREK